MSADTTAGEQPMMCPEAWMHVEDYVQQVKTALSGMPAEQTRWLVTPVNMLGVQLHLLKTAALQQTESLAWMVQHYEAMCEKNAQLSAAKG